MRFEYQTYSLSSTKHKQSVNTYLRTIKSIFSKTSAWPESFEPQSVKLLLFSRLLSKCIDQLLGRSTALPEPKNTADLNPLLDRFKEYDQLFQTNLLFQPVFETLPTSVSLLSTLQQLINADAYCSFTPLHLACLYESLVDTDTASKKKNGAFYTPPAAADRTIASALSAARSWAPAIPLRVLDPACGSGIFLLLAFKQLAHNLCVDSGFAERKLLLLQSLYGVDKNHSATALCRLLLQLELLSTERNPSSRLLELPSLSKNIRVGNSLLEPEHLDPAQLEDPAQAAELQPFSWKTAFPTVFSEGGFTHIIGNPPYGLARGRQLSSAENRKLKEVYSAVRSGKVNKYLLFLARSYELLRSQGALALIVPNAWLGIRDGLALRKMLLQAKALKEVDIFAERIFPDPSVEAVIATVVKGGTYHSLTIAHFDCIDSVQPSKSFPLSVEACLQNPDCTIPLHRDAEADSILKHLFAHSFPLNAAQSPFISAIALQAYSVGKGTPPQTKEVVQNHPYHSTIQETRDYYPYLEGSDISRYRIGWSGKYLKYGPWLAEPQKLERFTGPRLVLREIIAPPPYLLITAFTSEPFLYNKSVLHILPKQAAAPADLFWALLAILNSKTAAFIVYITGRKSQRALFPKIVNSDLKDFPLPATFVDQAAVLATLARERTRISLDGPASQFAALDERIDRQVAAAYELSVKDVSGLARKLV